MYWDPMTKACVGECVLGVESDGSRICAACPYNKYLDPDAKQCVEKCPIIADDNGVCTDCGASAPLWSAELKRCVYSCPSNVEDAGGVCLACADDEKMQLQGRIYFDDKY